MPSAVEENYKDEVLSLCDDIIDQPCWEDEIFKVFATCDDQKMFYAASAAYRLDINIDNELLSLIKSDPIKYSSYVQRLFKNPEMVTELIEIYETALPLGAMSEGMGDYIFSDTYRQEHNCLDFILPELAAYPLQGVSFIKTGLNSRVVRNRNMACRALAGWSKKLAGKPLDCISSELYTEVKRICEIEINEETKKTMQKLLAGDITDIWDKSRIVSTSTV